MARSIPAGAGGFHDSGERGTPRGRSFAAAADPARRRSARRLPERQRGRAAGGPGRRLAGDRAVGGGALPRARHEQLGAGHAGGRAAGRQPGGDRRRRPPDPGAGDRSRLRRPGQPVQSAGRGLGSHSRAVRRAAPLPPGRGAAIRGRDTGARDPCSRQRVRRDGRRGRHRRGGRAWPGPGGDAGRAARDRARGWPVGESGRSDAARVPNRRRPAAATGRADHPACAPAPAGAPAPACASTGTRAPAPAWAPAPACAPARVDLGRRRPARTAAAGRRRDRRPGLDLGRRQHRVRRSRSPPPAGQPPARPSGPPRPAPASSRRRPPKPRPRPSAPRPPRPPPRQ